VSELFYLKFLETIFQQLHIASPVFNTLQKEASGVDMKFSSGIKNLCKLVFASGILFSSHALTGKIIDTTGAGIEGALVQLTNSSLSDTSGKDGAWTIIVPSGIKSIVRKKLPAPGLKGKMLSFIVNDDNVNVKVSVFTLDGRFMYDALDKKLSAGSYRINPLDVRSLDAKIYAVRLQIGDDAVHFKLPALRGEGAAGISLQDESKTEYIGNFEKRTAIIDTVKVSKAGFTPALRPIASYKDSLTITLKAAKPSYYLNPPNPCYNRFVIDSCKKGDPNSKCGGNCVVANACSPPEDAGKSSAPKTFLCPRFMLYSTEMLEAAKNDALLYGWGDTANLPFNYGIVGHDPDVGGLDDKQSSCCQCYQLVFVKPEDSSPQPPDLPYPKPLVVQSFNTAAGGGKNFDVFMGAGGYGAFNACYKDAAFGSTTKFNEFIYSKFPYQNPGGGGISFLRYEKQCRKNWPPTVGDVQSAECQDTIRKLCDQALVDSSTQITEDTRRSCIQTNQVTSLYHQNWKIVAKRVRCPENLTRVTGCRLKEESLPLPLPKVQTLADATANGGFTSVSAGYTTTTMQDCCKPTCAWADNVLGSKLPVDGEWNSFYSCDKAGKPITK
jgi:hypothetical protein